MMLFEYLTVDYGKWHTTPPEEPVDWESKYAEANIWTTLYQVEKKESAIEGDQKKKKVHTGDDLSLLNDAFGHSSLHMNGNGNISNGNTKQISLSFSNYVVPCPTDTSD